jgi:putative dimethyl sulfoxide reductase chaperone
VIDHNAMKAAAAGRQVLYAVLSAYYLAPPSAELAAIVSSEHFADAARASVGKPAADFAAAVRRAVAGDPEPSSLEAEHTSLFVLPSGVVPHEAFYLDENRRLGGRITAAVQQSYDLAAAYTSEQCLELPDHIGVELEFMAFLCDLEEQFWASSELSGVGKCRELQRSFLEDHLLRWHAALCEKVEGEAALDLYRALARLTFEFLESERGHVCDVFEQASQEKGKSCELAS